LRFDKSRTAAAERIHHRRHPVWELLPDDLSRLINDVVERSAVGIGASRGAFGDLGGEDVAHPAHHQDHVGPALEHLALGSLAPLFGGQAVVHQ